MLRCEQRAGADHTFCRPCFSGDNKLLLLPNDRQVIAISAADGSLVSTISLDSRVAAIQRLTHSSDCAVVCTEDGVISTWNLESAERVDHFATDLRAVSHFVVAADGSAYVVGARQDGGVLGCFRVDLGGDHDVTEFVSNVPADFRRISFGAAFMAHLDSWSGYIKFYDSQQRLCFKPSNNKHKLTCVACHEFQNSIAVGTSRGQIMIWIRVGQPAEQKGREKAEVLGRCNQMIHWHQATVADLAWSPSGVTLWSGGDEAVLVKHSLHSDGRSTRQFLPRVGAPIANLALSADGAAVALAMRDNSVLVVDQHMGRMSSAQRLTRCRVEPPVRLQCDGAGALAEQSRGLLVVNASPGWLQFVAPADGAQQFSVDVCEQNAPPLESGVVLAWAEVVRVALGRDVMATVECRVDAVSGCSWRELALKFWHHSSDRSFQLNTTVEWPHDGEVGDLRFHPSEYSLVSTGVDGSFKIWQRGEKPSPYKAETQKAWKCVSSGRYKDLPARCAAFCDSGSVCAVGFGSMLTLWHHDTRRLLTANALHSSIAADDHIRRMQWGVADASCVVVCSTGSAVVGWDAKSLSALWLVRAPSSALALDSATGLLALFDKNVALVINPLRPKPLLRHVFDETVDVHSACFVAPPICAEPTVVADSTDAALHKWQSELLVFTRQQRLYSLYKDGLDERRIRKRKAPETTETAVVRVLKGKRNEATTIAKAPELLHLSNIQLLNGPAHSLPPLDTLAHRFIASCLIPRN